MMQSMNGYFAAEKSESLLFILVGLIAIGVALWLWMDGHRLKSMAFPLVAIAIIQLLVGSTVFFRTDTQAATLQQQYAAAPAKFKTEETARMQTVMNNFSTYKIIEIALLAIGIGLIGDLCELQWKRRYGNVAFLKILLTTLETDRR